MSVIIQKLMFCKLVSEQVIPERLLCVKEGLPSFFCFLTFSERFKPNTPTASRQIEVFQITSFLLRFFVSRNSFDRSVDFTFSSRLLRPFVRDYICRLRLHPSLRGDTASKPRTPGVIHAGTDHFHRWSCDITGPNQRDVRKDLRPSNRWPAPNLI